VALTFQQNGMTILAPLVATLVLLLAPGLAAVFWVARRTSARAGVSGLPETIAVAYVGLGVACLSLWLVCVTFGLSFWTALLAPLSAALVVAAAAGRRTQPQRPPDESSESAHTERAAADRLDDATAVTVLLVLSLTATILVSTPFLTYGWERADGFHRMAMSDWEKHLVMTTAVAASPTFPPPHPYIHADPKPSYYFGYHLVAAAIATVAGRPTEVFVPLLVLTLLTAAATPFVVYTFSKDICGTKAALLAAGLGALLVGFDFVVLLIDTVRATVAAWPLTGGFSSLRAVVPSTHIDYWVHNVDRAFSTPIVATMWAPHQPAATLLALLTLYLLAPLPGEPARARVYGLMLPSLVIAALPPLSSYIAMGLAVGVAGGLLMECVAARRLPWRTGMFRRWALPGAIATVLALPVYPTIAQGSSSGLVFHISTAGSWSNGAFVSWLFGEHQWTRLLDTPVLYLMELGAIGLLGTVQILHLVRLRTLTPVQQQTVALIGSVLVLLTFVRPPVDIGNNLYARALLLVWFALAPFAGAALLRIRRARWPAIAVLVSALGTCYVEVGYLLQGAIFWSTSSDAVRALRWINEHAPERALVAIHPADHENNFGYWLRRPFVLGNRRLALLFGANAEHYDRTAAALAAAYAETSPESARAAFDALNADVILVHRRRGDPAWAQAPCFQRAHPNEAWTVVTRDTASCERSSAAQTPR
jgi:hypothetical protein